jgi:hypothetical protein
VTTGWRPSLQTRATSADTRDVNGGHETNPPEVEVRRHPGHMPDNYLAWLVVCGLFAIVMVTVGAVSDPNHAGITTVGVIGVVPFAVLFLLWGIHAIRRA